MNTSHRNQICLHFSDPTQLSGKQLAREGKESFFDLTQLYHKDVHDAFFLLSYGSGQ